MKKSFFIFFEITFFLANAAFFLIILNSIFWVAIFDEPGVGYLFYPSQLYFWGAFFLSYPLNFLIQRKLRKEDFPLLLQVSITIIWFLLRISCLKIISYLFDGFGRFDFDAGYQRESLVLAGTVIGTLCVLCFMGWSKVLHNRHRPGS